jgi:hypothetical protein
MVQEPGGPYILAQLERRNVQSCVIVQIEYFVGSLQ